MTNGEEMDAEIARMDAFLRKVIREEITELTERIATERNPYARATQIKFLEGVRAIGGGKYV